MNTTTTDTNMINSWLLTNKVNECKTYYPKRHTETSTQDTTGYMVTTAMTPHYIYNKDGELVATKWNSPSWEYATNIKVNINLHDMIPYLKKAVWFRLKLKLEQRKSIQNKRAIRRDIAKVKNSITKSDKVIQPSRQKRVLPVAPSKLSKGL